MLKEGELFNLDVGGQDRLEVVNYDLGYDLINASSNGDTTEVIEGGGTGKFWNKGY